MSTLHERLLAWLGPKSGDEGMGPWGATRAVLELHAPQHYFESNPASHLVCLGCDFEGYDAERPSWPCRTIDAIASALGVQIGETP